MSNEKGDISAPAAQTPLPPLRFDVDEYRKYIEDEDLTEAQAEELLGAIWAVMVAFVDLGFGIHPVQQAMDRSRGKAELPPLDRATVLSCKESFSKSATQKPAKAATRPGGERKES